MGELLGDLAGGRRAVRGSIWGSGDAGEEKAIKRRGRLCRQINMIKRKRRQFRETAWLKKQEFKLCIAHFYAIHEKFTHAVALSLSKKPFAFREPDSLGPKHYYKLVVKFDCMILV